jgi:hypothetical protein
MPIRRPRVVPCVLALTLVLAAAPTTAVWAAKTVTTSGHLDFRKADYLIVDGQRVQSTSRTKFAGSGAAKSTAPGAWSTGCFRPSSTPRRSACTSS